MSTPRGHAGRLARLFNDMATPLYVLDDNLTLIFLNRACHEWLGPTAEELLGRKCRYHSAEGTAEPDAVAAGLCPPPDVLAGHTIAAPISCTEKDGRPSQATAQFTPILVGSEEVLAVIAVVRPGEQPLSSHQEFSGGSLHAFQRSGVSESIVLHQAIRRFRAEAASRYRADQLIGQGPAMRLARRQVELAASHRASVTIAGPAGSGRQHLAAAIHYADALRSSAGPAGALVTLDGSLLDADLIETAAIAIARGAEPSRPGSLLLHRIDELSPDDQLQLLHFFSHECSAWRLMATAVAPLGELAKRGNFHADLAALLSTMVIELPPLAQRREDLPLLAQLFLEEHNAIGPRQIAGFSPAALDQLDAYAWPGNLDELRQVVAEAYRRAGGHEIADGDLPERLRLAGQMAAQPRRTEETIVLDEYLARVERELIRRALARAKNNKARAARLLGVTRPRLYRRMVQLGLEE